MPEAHRSTAAAAGRRPGPAGLLLPLLLLPPALLLLRSAPALAEVPAGAPAEPADAVPRHPLTAVDLEAGGLPGGSAADLLDYHLGPLELTQDVLARDLVLLTTSRLVVLRLRAASVEQLNLRTLALLGDPHAAPGVARRRQPLSLEVPAELAGQAHLLRLLAEGVGEEVLALTLAAPRRSRHFLHVDFAWTAAGERYSSQPAGPELEAALIAGFAGLFPTPPAR